MPRLKMILQSVLLPATLFCILAPAQQRYQPRSADQSRSGSAAGERHTSVDPGSALYQRSTFAHGFIHGYEQGYHIADLDYHVGRTDRKLNDIREYRDAFSGYQSSFGDRNTFRQGYREGFSQGYDDSIHSRNFRAAMAASIVADSLRTYIGSNQELDAGFAAGFAAKHANLQSMPACTSGSSFGYCNGFTLGAEFAAISSGASPVIAKSGLDAVLISQGK